jgi:hypothetical protein
LRRAKPETKVDVVGKLKGLAKKPGLPEEKKPPEEGK